MAALTIDALAILLTGHEAMEVSLADKAHHFLTTDRRGARWRCRCGGTGEVQFDAPVSESSMDGRSRLIEVIENAHHRHVAEVIATAQRIADDHGAGHVHDWAMEHFGRAQRIMASLGRPELFTVPTELGGAVMHWRIDHELCQAMRDAGKVVEVDRFVYELMGLPVVVVAITGRDEPDDPATFELVVS